MNLDTVRSSRRDFSKAVKPKPSRGTLPCAPAGVLSPFASASEKNETDLKKKQFPLLPRTDSSKFDFSWLLQR